MSRPAPPGREVDHLVHSVDLFATIAELSGLDARQAVPSSVELDGISIVPYLSDPNQSALRQFVYSETIERNAHDVAVRNEKFKLLVPDGAGEELYDLTTDPFETTNLLSRGLSSEASENYDRLRSELTRLQGDASWFPFGTGCAGQGSTPNLATVLGGRPVYGQTFTTNITGLHASVNQCIGVLGFTRIALDLAPYNVPGCTLYVTLDVLTPITATNGTATFPVTIPLDGGLLGFRFFQQGIVFEPGANVHDAILTNAGEGCIERR